MIRRNVLILHTGALGDFVLSWPLILALGRLYAQSRIIVVTHASKGALAESALRVESSDIEHGWHGLFADGETLDDRAAKLLDGAQSIYSFHAGAGRIQTHAPHANVLSLTTIPPDGWTRHASDWLLEQLSSQPAIRAGVEQMLRSIATRGVGTGRSHDGDVVIHPGSGSREKCWPVAKFLELIDRFKRARRDVRVILGEVELARFSADEIRSFEQVATVRKPANYLQLFNELRSAAELVANDSGPAHLGAIVGVPTLALFGPTDPVVWKPLGPHVSVMREHPIDKLTSAKVFTAAKSLWNG